MATRLGSALVLVTTLVPLTSALQVAPSSPCESICLNSDSSNFNLTRIANQEFACADDEFSDTEGGRKFEDCLTCLEDSTYSSERETDQGWYLYHLRNSFDYCVLGGPNDTDKGHGPCATSEGCGHLLTALKTDIVDPDGTNPYEYCDVDQGIISTDEFDDCHTCVGVDHPFLANFLTALRAGCDQRPAPGILLALNDTVFTPFEVEYLDPDAAKEHNSVKLGPPVIAGIAIGSFLFLALIAGCTVFQLRRRRKAREAANMPRMSFGGNDYVYPQSPRFAGHEQGKYAQSPYYGQTTFAGFPEYTPSGAPLSPGFQYSHHGDYLGREHEKAHVAPGEALSSNPTYSENNIPGNRMSMMNEKLNGIDTIMPVHPPPTHPSPLSPQDYYATPTSTISTRSNAALLGGHHRPYVPSEYADSPPSIPAEFTQQPQNVGLAISSPIAEPQQVYVDEKELHWPGQQHETPVRAGRKKGPTVGTPVESTTMQTSFPPPPKR